VLDCYKTLYGLFSSMNGGHGVDWKLKHILFI